MRLPITLAAVLFSFVAVCAVPQGDGAWAADGQKAVAPYGTLTPFVRPPVAAPVPVTLPVEVYRQIARAEAAKAGMPFDLADAVMKVESSYDPTRIGGVGEIGLMQIRPQTAAMLGFKGSDADLATPATNIHYGVTYLARAWQLANGDVCRALMKYRAGHGEETMTEKSVTYCARAKAHLASRGSALADGGVPVASLSSPVAPSAGKTLGRGRGPLHGAAFWAAHDARVRQLTAAVHAKWHMAAR